MLYDSGKMLPYDSNVPIFSFSTGCGIAMLSLHYKKRRDFGKLHLLQGELVSANHSEYFIR